ncbi:MAG: DNA polymerase III subunit gamma/tau, partial [Kosmotoga sp.]
MGEVLYRKYRPLNFDELIGQNQVKDILKKALDKGKVSHAYIFYGPRGTGKTTTARILA